jgi:hypothetical protein
MLPVANLPEYVKGVSRQTLEHINNYAVVGCRLASMARYQVVRDLVVLFVVASTSILKIRLS